MHTEKAKEELKNYLDSLSILILRTLARQVGVYNPTKTAKDELILQIIAVLTGEAEPCEPSKRGAPVKEASIDVKYMRGLQAICEKYENEEAYEENVMAVHSSQKPSGALSSYDLPLYKGILEIQPNGCGYVRIKNCQPTAGKDVFVPLQLICEQDLREGDCIVCHAFTQKGNNNPIVSKILSANGKPVPSVRRSFDSLSVTRPDGKIVFSAMNATPLLRVVDLFTPVARGQRVLLEAPMGTDVNALLLELSLAVKKLSGEKETVNLHPLALFLQQRPEDAEDFLFLPQGDFACTGFNSTAEEHLCAARILFNRARRLAEIGEDAVIFVDSLTKLSRAFLSESDDAAFKKSAYNADMGALNTPKQYFLDAGKFKGGGSLTVIAVVNTDEHSDFESRIYEEFKPMANCHIALSFELARRHIFPAIDLLRSYTEREERLLTAEELHCVCLIRENLLENDGKEGLELLKKTPDNQAFIRAVKERFGE